MQPAGTVRVFSLQIQLLGLSVCGLSDRKADIMQLSGALRHRTLPITMPVGHSIKLTGFLKFTLQTVAPVQAPHFERFRAFQLSVFLKVLHVIVGLCLFFG